ncbi:MAG: hypothetical protein NC300_10835 [Bacteroidales bacterium]|nr:hypothetical protein [Clostridium sp.]MCM1204626.1 hypothetical protein [Bacteroidales bacterium]
MRVVNAIVYVLVIILFILWRRVQKKEGSAAGKYVKEHGYVLICILAVNSLSLGIAFKEDSSDRYIKKEGYGGEEHQLALVLEKEDEQKEITLAVQPRKLTGEQQKKRMEEAFSYLEEHIKGQNTTLEEVVTNLDFSLDKEEYPFDAEFRPADFALLDEEGKVKNSGEELLAAGYTKEELEAGIPTAVTVSLWYGEESRERTYPLKIFPQRVSSMEQLFFQVEEKLKKKEQEAECEEGFVLPETVEGVKITTAEEKRKNSVYVLVLGMVFIGLLLLREQENKKQKKNRRQDKLRRCYPWFVNELVLLLGAGMQVQNIISLLLREYAEEKKDARKTNDREPLMQELLEAQNGFRLGMSEAQVYYGLGRRLELPCYIKLMTLLEQNVKRGTKGLMAIMEQEELAALEERKTLAKRYGEEAGTKLLGPMVLLLIVVMMMIMIPAFLSMA